MFSYSMTGQEALAGSRAYSFRLSKCIYEENLPSGKLIHSHLVKHGFDNYTFLENLVMQMYGNCGDLKNACGVFVRICEPNVFSWNIIISVYLKHGYQTGAQMMFDDMPQRDIVSWNLMLSLHTLLGNVEDAQGAFNRMPEKNLVSWNSIISLHSHYGHSKEALQLFQQMQLEGMLPNPRTFVGIFCACACKLLSSQGKHIHAQVLLRTELNLEIALGNALINMYVKCNCLEAAIVVFNYVSRRDVISWSTIITCLAKIAHGWTSANLLQQMKLERLMPDFVIFVIILDSWVGNEELAHVKKLHSHNLAVKSASNIALESTLIKVYGNCDSLDSARMLFNAAQKRDTRLWNAMIAVYAQYGHSKEALQLFNQMRQYYPKPDVFTFVSVLDACAKQRVITTGKVLHALLIRTPYKSNTVVGNVLVTMYSKCGSLEEAEKIFIRMNKWDVISCNSILGAYSTNNDCVEKAMECYKQMQTTGIDPDAFTFNEVFSTISCRSDLPGAKKVHAHLFDHALDSDLIVGNALINMYSKCGSLKDACVTFCRMSEHDIHSWTAIISSYVQHGLPEIALETFSQMQQDGLMPHSITLVSIISACTHAGLENEGYYYFISMSRQYEITPTGDHCNCIVDCLGHTGLLDEAEDVIHSSPLKPTGISWMTLLDACKIES